MANTAAIGFNFRAIGDLIFSSSTLDVASLLDAAGATSTVTVVGAALGDFVPFVSLSVDIQSITVTAWVSAANVVSVRFQNEAAATIDLASATLRLVVVKANGQVWKNL